MLPLRVVVLVHWARLLEILKTLTMMMVKLIYMILKPVQACNKPPT